MSGRVVLPRGTLSAHDAKRIAREQSRPRPRRPPGVVPTIGPIDDNPRHAAEALAALGGWLAGDPDRALRVSCDEHPRQDGLRFRVCVELGERRETRAEERTGGEAMLAIEKLLERAASRVSRDGGGTFSRRTRQR